MVNQSFLMDLSALERATALVFHTQTSTWLKCLKHTLKAEQNVLACFGLANMNLHNATIDIFISKMADFTNAKSSRIHDSNHSLCLISGMVLMNSNVSS